MRQRRVKNLDEKLTALSSHMIENPEEHKGKWHEVFGNDNPIYLELGCGKGKFISTHAAKYPDRNFIGAEGQPTVILRALEKAEELGEKNLFFICGFVRDVREYFAPGEIAGVYLNFSDPWPKSKHGRRRLTYHEKLTAYTEVMREGGFIEIKTDNEGLFEFTLEQIEEAGLTTIEMTRDLHAEGTNVQSADAREITTEYEDKFVGTGKNINYVKVQG
ncbi:MAG: tRNA (guanosine(46)-N7)-methyltransferase TrmB [Firmicutes bacterium]|nr:tRNA (guanosine(46)-N7)-methyltransferase TrmB [Bacillota bacterium]